MTLECTWSTTTRRLRASHLLARPGVLIRTHASTSRQPLSALLWIFPMCPAVVLRVSTWWRCKTPPREPPTIAICKEKPGLEPTRLALPLAAAHSSRVRALVCGKGRECDAGIWRRHLHRDRPCVAGHKRYLISPALLLAPLREHGPPSLRQCLASTLTPCASVHARSSRGEQQRHADCHPY